MDTLKKWWSVLEEFLGLQTIWSNLESLSIHIEHGTSHSNQPGAISIWAMSHCAQHVGDFSRGTHPPGSNAAVCTDIRLTPDDLKPCGSSGYGSIPIDTFLVGWTSIYQLFWGSLGTRVLTHPLLCKKCWCDVPSYSNVWLGCFPLKSHAVTLTWLWEVLFGKWSCTSNAALQSSPKILLSWTKQKVWKWCIPPKWSLQGGKWWWTTAFEG